MYNTREKLNELSESLAPVKIQKGFNFATVSELQKFIKLYNQRHKV